MEDHRGIGEQAITSWVQGQACDPNQFELIILTNGKLGELSEQFAQLLRPQDTHIDRLGEEIELYDHAVKSAKGEFLLFSEPHCRAEPDTIVETIKFFDTTDFAGFCVRTIPEYQNKIGELEAIYYEECLQRWKQPSDWRKVIMRGFGIRKHTFSRVGGFQSQYDRFAEWLLAATLHQQGHELAYAESVAVHHNYTTDLEALDFFINNFTKGECLYRLDAEPDLVQRYFGCPPEWDDCLSIKRKQAISMIKMYLQQIVGNGGVGGSLRGKVHCIYQTAKLLLSIAKGPSWDLLSARIRCRWSKFRIFFWWFSRGRQYRAFSDYFADTARAERLRMLADFPSDERSVIDASSSIHMKNATRGELTGFHVPEEHLEGMFRWTTSAAAVNFLARKDNYWISIQLLSANNVHIRSKLSVFLNSNEISDMQYDAGCHVLGFRADRDKFIEGVQSIVLLCLPSKTAKGDRRQRGLPIRSISISPVE